MVDQRQRQWVTRYLFLMSVLYAAGVLLGEGGFVAQICFAIFTSATGLSIALRPDPPARRNGAPI